MCLACEEANLFYRFELLKQIADGKMPAGVTAEDLRAMGLPLPHEIEVINKADGTKEIRHISPQSAADNLACDSPNS